MFLQRTQLVARPRSEVFAFFADASNLERITPAFLRFHITTPLPIEMRAGALIDYRLRLYGVPIRWRSRIEEYEPAGGTEVVDTVEYETPPIGNLARRLFVAPSLERIFEHRRRVIAEVFAA